MSSQSTNPTSSNPPVISNAQIAVFTGEYISQARVTSPQGLYTFGRESMEAIGYLLVDIGYDLLRAKGKR